MQALKALVIFMGVLIAIGVTVIGVTVYRRATDMVSDNKAAPSATMPSAAGQSGAAAPQIPPAVNPDSMPPGAVQGGAGAALTLPNAAPQSFGSRDLELPPGSEIASVQVIPAQGGARVLVHARLRDGGTRILVLDPARGNIAGEWRVPGAQAPGEIPGGAAPP